MFFSILGEAFDSDPFPAPCSSILLDNQCFGLFRYSGTSYAQPQYRFKWVNNDPALGASPSANVRDNNPVTSQSRPHVEWTFMNFNQFRQRAGFAQVTPSQDWSFQMLAFAGTL